jgi:hypothetical protein
MQFEDPPLVPREELPEEFQPHRSFYGKVACFVNGIDPYPPKQKQLNNPIDSSNNSVSIRDPLRDI